MGLELGRYSELSSPLASLQGDVIVELRDSTTGELLEYRELKNLITYDSGILAARLFHDSTDPAPAANNGLTMLAVGTGATGNILSPDAPQRGQRSLNTEIERKAFSSVQFRNDVGAPVSYPTNIVDFTTVFAESEAVGPLNEMGLMCTASTNPLIKNPLPPGPSGYDPTIDVTGYDIMVNYLTFGVISKPNNAILTLTWRLTF
jgi:hypothetical protein